MTFKAYPKEADCHSGVSLTLMRWEEENPGKIIFHESDRRRLMDRVVSREFRLSTMSMLLVHHHCRGMFIKINSSIKVMHRPRELNRL